VLGNEILGMHTGLAQDYIYRSNRPCCLSLCILVLDNAAQKQRMSRFECEVLLGGVESGERWYRTDSVIMLTCWYPSVFEMLGRLEQMIIFAGILCSC
jgi:hypothetical protein